MSAVGNFGRVMLGALILAVGPGVFLPGVPSASAQTPASRAAGAPSQASIALARELLELKGGQQMFEGMVNGVIESAKNSFLPNNPNLNRPLNEVAVQLRKDFEVKKLELANEVARVYARRFTEQELRELLAFYKTTLGRKVLSEESLAVEDGFKRAQDWTNEFSDQVLTKMRAEMRKKGYEL